MTMIHKRWRIFGGALLALGALCVASASRSSTDNRHNSQGPLASLATRALDRATEAQIGTAWAGGDAGAGTGSCVLEDSASFYLLIDRGGGPAPLAMSSYSRAFVTVTRGVVNDDYPTGVLNIHAVACFHTLYNTTTRPRIYIPYILVCDSTISPETRRLLPGQRPQCRFVRGTCSPESPLYETSGSSATEGSDLEVVSLTDTHVEIRIPRVNSIVDPVETFRPNLSNIVFRADHPGGGFTAIPPNVYRATAP